MQQAPPSAGLVRMWGPGCGVPSPALRIPPLCVTDCLLMCLSFSSRYSEHSEVIMRRTILITLFTVVSFQLQIQAQVWEQLDSPSGGSIDAMTRVDRSIVAIQTFGGVYRTENDGEEWHFLTDALSSMAIFDMASSPAGVLYVIGFQGLAISGDKGTTWETKRLPFIPASIAFTQSGDLLVGASGSIMRSSDDGENWVDIIPNPAVSRGYNVAVSESGTWFAGAYRSGFYRSTNEGASWDRLDGGMSNSDVYSVSALSASLVIVGLSSSAWSSVDDGLTWNRISALDSVNTFGIVSGNDGALYASTTGGLAISTDNGVSWLKTNYFRRVFGIVPSAFGILVAADGKLQTSIDAGANWWPASEGMKVPIFTGVLAVNGESSLLLAGTEAGGLYVSTNNGNAWSTADVDVPYGYTVRDISAPSTDRIAVLTDDLYLLTCENGPADWSVKALPSTTAQLQALNARNDGVMHLGNAVGSVFRSDNWGDTWAEVGQIELPGSPVNIFALRQDVLRPNRPLYAATDRGLFRSDNDGASWSEVTPGGIRRAVVEIAVTPGASQPVRVVVAALENEVFRSSDAGVTWQSIITTSTQQPVLDMFITREGHVVCLAGNVLYAWNSDTGLLHSYTLPGETTAVTGKDLGGRYYAATRLRGLYRTQVDILGIGQVNPPTAAVLEMHIAPTPFGASVSGGTADPVLHFTLDRRSTVTLAVFDVAGRLVTERDLGIREAGMHMTVPVLPDMPSGAYRFVLLTERRMRSCVSLHLR